MRMMRPSPMVYPRVCGGNLANAAAASKSAGLSPRVRGKPSPRKLETQPARSIPACAGETKGRCQPPVGLKVYPRVCGGNDLLGSIIDTNQGLSPRVRGKPTAYYNRNVIKGSIPACAGETRRTPSDGWNRKVYPRVCGGNGIDQPCDWNKRGLSPRVRGKRVYSPVLPIPSRSIPACAGETNPYSRFRVNRKVYPRVCGGNQLCWRYERSNKGLSPRVRGKLLTTAPPTTTRRSIPACAGETNWNG